MSLIFDIFLGFFAFLFYVASHVTSNKKNTSETSSAIGESSHIKKQSFLNKPRSPWYLFALLFLLVAYAFFATKTNSLFLGLKISNQAADCIVNGNIIKDATKEECDQWHEYFKNNPITTPTPMPIVPVVRQNTTVQNDPPVHCPISKECGGGTTPLKQSECSNSTCCGFPGGKWVFYKDKNQCIHDQGGTSTIPSKFIIPTTANLYDKISCSFTGSGYSYDFGQLTYAECTTKSNQYWNDQNIKTQISITQVQVSKPSQEQIDKCIAEVNAEFENLKQICINILPPGSAVDSCIRARSEQSTSQISNCKTTGSHTTINGSINLPPTPTPIWPLCLPNCSP